MFINTIYFKHFIIHSNIIITLVFLNQGASMEVLRPPVLLYAKEFNRVYQDKLEVLNAKDLHIHPPYCVPCINVSSPDFISPFLFNLSSNTI